MVYSTWRAGNPYRLDRPFPAPYPYSWITDRSRRSSSMRCRRLLRPLRLSLAAVLVATCSLNAAAKADADERARAFLKDHEARFRPLEVAGALAWWNANISGKDEDFKKKEDAQNR